MTIVKPKTKEQTVYFLVSNISLGTYDKRFLQNIEDTYVVLNKPMTSNQAKLLDKVISRYHRQLAKLEVNSNELLDLPWTYPPIESLPQYTEVYLDLIDDTLVLRSPYKKEFVTEFRKNELDAKWDGEARFWYIPASTNSLKIVNDLIIKHYTKINYCNQITEFFDSLTQYEKCKYWNPTYKYVNGNFMIASTNKWLDEALQDITLDDNLSTLSRLVWYGVIIDESVVSMCKNKYDDVLIDFAIKVNPEIEMQNTTVIVDNIVKTGVDFVYIYYKLHRGSAVKELVDAFEKHNIDHKVHDPNSIFYSPVHEYTNPVILCDRAVSNLEHEITKTFAKVIRAVNSKPITIQ